MGKRARRGETGERRQGGGLERGGLERGEIGERVSYGKEGQERGDRGEG